MSRTLAAGLVSHLATSTHSRASMLRLDLVDGSTLAVTDHDRTLTLDLGDGSADYSPRTGIMPSDLSLSTGFDADEVEVTGPLVDEATEDWHVTKAAIVGGRFDDADARFFQVNWNSLSSGPIRLLKGRVVLAQVEGGRFKLTIRSEISRFAQEVGRTITPYCDADFGDARCGYSPIIDSVTVLSVTDARTFVVSNLDDRGEAFFNGGTVRNWAGVLAGHKPVEISTFEATLPDEATITLWMELAEAPEVGATLDLRQGCYDPATGHSKTRAACLLFGNVVNFRGFPDVPGSDQVLRYPNPGG